MTGTLPVVVASVPQVCEVCHGERQVLISGPGQLLTATVPCLHCQWRLPIVVPRRVVRQP